MLGHAPPCDGAASYEHHGLEREAYAAAEQLAAHLARVRRPMQISGGAVGTPGGWKTTPACAAVRKALPDTRSFLELAPIHVAIISTISHQSKGLSV